jgi:nucleoside phosphorylase
VTRRTLFVGAMDRELSDLIAHYAAEPQPALFGAYPFWVASHGVAEIGIVQTHVGEANAAIATSEAIRCFRPDCVFKLGCVGGHAAGIHTGDVVAPVSYFHSGAWITRAAGSGAATADATRWHSVFGPLPYQVNSENLGGRPHILTPDAHLTEAWLSHAIAHGLSGVRACIGGSAMWFFDHAFMPHVLAAQVPNAVTPAWVADMESYAVAQACAVHAVPFTGLYRVSNSEYYDEPYVPETVAGLFAGAFIQVVAAFVRALAA